MKEIKKLAKRGWYKAMIHQGTLSLILTLDDFLISGPHLSTTVQELSELDPNIFYVKSSKLSDKKEEEKYSISTYFLLRPYIRGILYGLNPLYQLSLYVPCKDQETINLYREIISKIDIGGQFFQDRIYWNYEALKNDIMDTRLACLIYAGDHFALDNDWIKKIAIASRPFCATIGVDFTKNDNLFDLVEMRSFFEDVHQRYFSLLNESKRLYFADMIRLHINEKIPNDNCGMNNRSQFHSARNGQSNKNDNNNTHKRFQSQGYSLKDKEIKEKKGLPMFETFNASTMSWNTLNTNALLDEYGEIIKEQLEINHSINNEDLVKVSFAKLLCRWNTITQRKSDVLKLLMEQNDKNYIQERLHDFNSMYSSKKFQSQNDLFVSVHSFNSDNLSRSNSNNDSILSSHSEPKHQTITPFTTWYSKELIL